uniref:Secreted protein n=1 Tax=Mesocestoides corti TaxID=53468 RepID=A0A5K3FFJ6_MESCO
MSKTRLPMSITLSQLLLTSGHYMRDQWSVSNRVSVHGAFVTMAASITGCRRLISHHEKGHKHIGGEGGCAVRGCAMWRAVSSPTHPPAHSSPRLSIVRWHVGLAENTELEEGAVCEYRPN